MKIIKFDINKNPKIDNNSKYVIALGKFSSFHKGHQSIFKKAKEISIKENKKLIIMIFPNYDGFNDKVSNFILPYEIRIRMLKQYNPSYILEFEPNPKNYNVTREKFIDYLKNYLNVTNVVIGKNFSFGKDKSFDDHLILRDNFNLNVLPLYKINNRIVSTKLIEEVLIEDKNIDSVKKMLGFNFFYEGVVSIGEQLGSKYKIPTANIKVLEGTIIPGEGIYFSYFYINNKRYNSITSISNNPTTKNDSNIYWETHILDFNENIYKKYVRVEFLKFLREPIKFENLDELFNKISKDIEIARNYFKKL